jgi:hypothetical protein
MTKLLLALGANTTTASSWGNERDTIILGFYNAEYCKGNAPTFAKALKKINSGQLSEESMERMIELTLEEVFLTQDQRFPSLP